MAGEGDYTKIDTLLVFSPNVTIGKITITSLKDSKYEAKDEQLAVYLSDAVGATLDSRVVVQVRDEPRERERDGEGRGGKRTERERERETEREGEKKGGRKEREREREGECVNVMI